MTTPARNVTKMIGNALLIAAFTVASAGGAAWCYSNLSETRDAKFTLEQTGYSQVNIAFSPFSRKDCSLKDSFRATYSAAGKDGKSINGVICGELFGTPRISRGI